MSPLDDELRRTLAARASLLTPSPDPLAGIEERARGIRRRRAAASVAGAAIAVAAVAVSVPLLSDGRPSGAPQRLATQSPTSSSYALDAARPWAPRGATLSDGTLATYRQDWQLRHPGSTLHPLFTQTHEPSATQETVFVADGPDEDRYGVVQATESGPELVIDFPLPDGTTALQLALPGDEVARLVVVAAPAVTGFEYAPDGAAYQAMTRLADGVAITALEGEQAVDRLRVTGPDGVLFEGEALEPIVVEPDQPSEQLATVLDWGPRGDAKAGPSINDLKAAFSRMQGRSDGAEVFYRALFTGDTDSGVRFTVGQVWFEGDSRANTVTYATGTTKGAVLTDHGYTPEAPTVLAGLVTSLPGTTVDLLVVVPIPGTGQVSYSSEPTGSFRPVSGQDHLDGVVLVDRAKGETDDRIEVLDGHGDLDKPLYRGSVADVLDGDPVH